MPKPAAWPLRGGLAALCLMGGFLGFYALRGRRWRPFLNMAHLQAGEAVDLPGLAWRLGHPAGVGFAGPGAAGLLRAILVELLVAGPDKAKVVIGYAELNRLLGDQTQDIPWREFLPQLLVCELLEDAIEDLERRMAPIAPQDDVSGQPEGGGRIYWFAAASPDSDVIEQLLQKADNRRIAALLIGAWPHGRTYTVGDDPLLGTFSATPALPSMTAAQAVSHLRAHASGS